MKIPKQRQKGFILVFVIVAIIIIGIEMFVLSGMANTMQYQSHRAYLKACERNLLASGLVWARENAQKSSRESFDQPIQLDVSEMDVPGSALEVTLGVAGEDREVRIQTSCRRGRQTLKNSDTYKIERYDQQKTTPGTRENSAGH
jgi:type II secretory pathway pseudopilin PulG